MPKLQQLTTKSSFFPPVPHDVQHQLRLCWHSLSPVTDLGTGYKTLDKWSAIGGPGGGRDLIIVFQWSGFPNKGYNREKRNILSVPLGYWEHNTLKF